MYMGYNSNLIEFMGGRYNVRTSITKRNHSSNHIFACSFDLVAHNSEKKGKLSFLVRNKETYCKKQKEMDTAAIPSILVYAYIQTGMLEEIPFRGFY